MNNKNVYLVVALIVVIAAGGFFLTVSLHSQKMPAVKGIKTKANISKSIVTPTQILSPQASPSVSLAPSGQASQDQYKDGMYDVMGNYQSPGGAEQIEVKVTLKKNTITDVTVISEARRPKSQEFQQVFINNYKPLVMGKNINDVHLDKVSGSSLTPQGFNDAISQIEQQAKV